MNITSIDLANHAGAMLADEFLQQLEASTITDGDDLYRLVKDLAYAPSCASDATLKAALHRIQKQLEVQR